MCNGRQKDPIDKYFYSNLQYGFVTFYTTNSILSLKNDINLFVIWLVEVMGNGLQEIKIARSFAKITTAREARLEMTRNLKKLIDSTKNQ